MDHSKHDLKTAHFQYHQIAQDQPLQTSLETFPVQKQIRHIRLDP